MKSIKQIFMVFGVILLCLISGWVGFRTGIEAKASKTHKQIECLKEMWGEPLTLNQHERVRSLEHDPDAVRSYFLDLLRDDGWTGPGGFITNSVKLKKGEGVSDLSRLDQMKPRAVLLLQQWQPGQTDIRNTAMPQYLQDGKAPLWNLYLSNPHAAWARGADDLGAGGK